MSGIFYDLVSYSVKGLDTFGRFSTIFEKGDNFWDFLFAPTMNPQLKRGLLFHFFMDWNTVYHFMTLAYFPQSTCFTIFMTTLVFISILIICNTCSDYVPPPIGRGTNWFWCGSHWCRCWRWCWHRRWHMHDTFLSAQYLVNQWLDFYQIFMKNWKPAFSGNNLTCAFSLTWNQTLQYHFITLTYISFINPL